MPALALLALVVAAAFLTSGLAKLGGSTQLAEAARRFRLPTAFAKRGWARVFIACEIAIGVVIAFAPSPWSGLAVAAATLVLAGFLALAVRAWRRGDDFDCGCFGVSGSTRVGPGLVARNAALLAAALGALLTTALGGPAPLDLLGNSEGRVWLAVVTVIAVGTLLVTRLTADDRVRAATQEARAALPASSPPSGMAPSFEVVRANGEVVESLMLVAHRAHLLVFVRPSCDSCSALLDDTPALDATLGADGPVLAYAVTVARSVFEESFPHLADRALYGVASASEKLGIDNTPGAVLLGLNRRLIAGPVIGETQVRELIADARRLLAQPLPPL